MSDDAWLREGYQVPAPDSPTLSDEREALLVALETLERIAKADGQWHGTAIATLWRTGSLADWTDRLRAGTTDDPRALGWIREWAVEGLSEPAKASHVLNKIVGLVNDYEKRESLRAGTTDEAAPEGEALSDEERSWVDDFDKARLTRGVHDGDVDLLLRLLRRLDRP